MNIDGLHLCAQYRIDLDRYKQSYLPEKQQLEVILRELSEKIADMICHKKSFFKEEIVNGPSLYDINYKRITADCYVLTEKEFFDLVENIKKGMMQYFPIGHIDIVDNKG